MDIVSSGAEFFLTVLASSPVCQGPKQTIKCTKRTDIKMTLSTKVDKEYDIKLHSKLVIRKFPIKWIGY